MDIKQKLFGKFKNRLQEFNQDEEKSISFLRLSFCYVINKWIDNYIEQRYNQGDFAEFDEQKAKSLLFFRAFCMVYGENACEITHNEILDLVEIYLDENNTNNKSA